MSEQAKHKVPTATAKRAGKKTKRRVWVWALTLIVIGFLLGMGVAYASAIGILETGDAKFCGSCHVMSTMVASYEADVHGGMNKNGIVVKCADCHIPKESLHGYIIEKSRAGMNDVWVNTFGDLEAIDWEERRTHRSHYTFDSSCMKCHKNLEEATMGDHKAFIAHKAYFNGSAEKTCVDCHENVGHKNLGLYLKKRRKK